ncbi:glycosyltransferase [Planctomycetota bacterium]
MAKSSQKKVVFISSYSPRKCGIATFTSDLIKSTAIASDGDFEPLVVAMRSGEQKYDDPVKFEIHQDVKSDYICAADYINFSHVDVVSVQHEFGLFGGDAGQYLSLLLNRLKAPIFTTVHTVLDDPAPDYYKSMVDLCNASHRIITMNKRGVDMLREIYRIPARKIKLIAHGIPDLPFVDSNYYKHKFGLEDRRTILTFGLLSKNKGIEIMLKAMPAIIEVDPSVIYIVLGLTHPNVLKHDGESYRFSLQQIVKDLGLEEHVIFHNRFVSDQELHNFLCATDIYVTPYQNEKQLTSGTLSFAVGTGKAVVSTPYWAAEELLADRRGKIVPFGNSGKIGQAIVEILNDDSLYYSLRRRAYEYGRSRTWPKIGQVYWKMFSAKRLPVRIPAGSTLSVAETISNIEVPEPSLEHLIKLTDDTGLFQHAKFTIPNREYGYCTDDNARGVITMARYYAQYPDPKALELLDKYLSFSMHSQKSDGTVRNMMSFKRLWFEKEAKNDAFGRILWAFGTIIAKPPKPAYLSIVKDCFDRSVPHIDKQMPKGMAYSILGMCDYLLQFPGASDIKRQLELATDGLVRQYEENNYPDWDWFEDALTYDNAVLPHALFAAGFTCENKKYLSVAEKTCEFLLKNTFNGKHFSFIGCNGWYERGSTKATFDQQPIEAASTVMMLRAAYDATQKPSFLTLERKAFDWFLGWNDLHISLYDFGTKGCYDGLMNNGVNLNQGAESTLSFIISLLAIVESFAIIGKVQNDKNTIQPQKNIVSDETEKNVRIKSISLHSSKTKSDENMIEKLTS